jgi:hypothetical protein
MNGWVSGSGDGFVGFWEVFGRPLAGFSELPANELLNEISDLRAIWQVWQVF